MIRNLKNLVEFNPSEETVTKDRDKYIGGSDVPIIMGTSAFKNAYDLKLEKEGIKTNEFKGNYYTEYGHSIEPYVRDYINHIKGTEFEPACYVNEKEKIRTNMDGLDIKNKMILEVKSNGGKHYDINDYKQQMMLYMEQTGIKKGYLAMYTRTDVEDFRNIRPDEFYEDNVSIIEIDYDETMAKEIKDTIKNFQSITKKDMETLSNPLNFYTKLYGVDNQIKDNLLDGLESLSDLKIVDKMIDIKLSQIENQMIYGNENVKKQLEEMIQEKLSGEIITDNYTIKVTQPKTTFSVDKFNDVEYHLTSEEFSQVVEGEKESKSYVGLYFSNNSKVTNEINEYIKEFDTNKDELSSNLTDKKLSQLLDFVEPNESTPSKLVEDKKKLEQYRKLIKAKVDIIKANLVEELSQPKLRTTDFDNGVVKLTNSLPKIKFVVNEEKLKELRPDVYAMSTVTASSPSISIIGMGTKRWKEEEKAFLQNNLDNFKEIVSNEIKNIKDNFNTLTLEQEHTKEQQLSMLESLKKAKELEKQKDITYDNEEHEEKEETKTKTKKKTIKMK